MSRIVTIESDLLGGLSPGQQVRKQWLGEEQNRKANCGRDSVSSRLRTRVFWSAAWRSASSKIGLAGWVRRGYHRGDGGEGVDDRRELRGPLLEPLENDKEVHVAKDAAHEDGLGEELEEELQVPREVQGVPACMTVSYL